MISKKALRENDDKFDRLAHYVAAAEDQDEKLDCLWIVNCDVGETLDDLDLAIVEIDNTQ
ncbi:MAG: hypothetical protein HRT36_08830 [Alphaproteobacteria bacterium]|nr:hypothetical protein [Alphaproteobacteria bacterium]